ncbi:MAG: hydrolase, partial [Bacteroidota bacterium]|nr:hydrolase [Bacteroidota bacterium]
KDAYDIVWTLQAFGRAGPWEYGGFTAMTGAVAYTDDEETFDEPRATFASGRIKRQILENSDMGVLFVGKWSDTHSNGVIDIDGAFRGAGWQLAYQFARSFRDGDGDFAASFGYTNPSESWLSAVRGRTIGRDFDIDDVGYVPWQGTAEIIGFTGPRWYFPEGEIRQILLYGGGGASYEHADLHTDLLVLLGYNMQFRANWGGEINFTFGPVKEEAQEFTAYETTFSTWFHVSPAWEANLWGGYARAYNFDRDWLAFYHWLEFSFGLHVSNTFYATLDAGQWAEGNPDGGVEDITWNARPALTVTPVNNLSFRLYVDNVFVRSSDRMERIIAGFLVSWNFLPKSWVYFAINDVRDRSEEFDGSGRLLPSRMHILDQAAVLKIKYLYYF